MHVIHQHCLTQNAYGVTLCRVQDRCRNDLDIALCDSVLTPPCPPRDMRVEFERLVPIVLMKHSHSGSTNPAATPRGFKEWETRPLRSAQPKHHPRPLPHQPPQ